MIDFMLKATNATLWSTFVATFTPEEVANMIIDEIGPVVTTPAVHNASGEITTPAVINTAHHVNVRVTNDDPALAAKLSEGGDGVTWVDPATVATPVRVWLGGMNYHT